MSLPRRGWLTLTVALLALGVGLTLLRTSGVISTPSIERAESEVADVGGVLADKAISASRSFARSDEEVGTTHARRSAPGVALAFRDAIDGSPIDSVIVSSTADGWLTRDDDEGSWMLLAGHPQGSHIVASSPGYADREFVVNSSSRNAVVDMYPVFLVRLTVLNVPANGYDLKISRIEKRGAREQFVVSTSHHASMTVERWVPPGRYRLEVLVPGM